MDAQQLGERLGGLERGQQELDRRMEEMQRVSTVEHGEVKKLLTDLKGDLAEKADKANVDDLEGRTDSLEGFRDNWKGRAVVLGPLAAAAIALATGLLLQITGGG